MNKAHPTTIKQLRTRQQPQTRKFMGSSNNFGQESNPLGILAQRLRLYKPARIHQIPETATEPDSVSDAVNSNGKSENLKRAAVLVCIFRGNNDDLRVILTKRSSTLSSHSGTTLQ